MIFLDTSPTSSKMPDIFLKTVKIPDIFRFFRQVVTVVLSITFIPIIFITTNQQMLLIYIGNSILSFLLYQPNFHESVQNSRLDQILK